MIVGFPGETERNFEELIKFVEWARFEKVGVFPFSPEEDTPAATLRPRPRNATVHRRCEALMEVQRDISREIGSQRVGRTVPVIIDGPSETPDFALEGRTQWDAPEIDGRVLFREASFVPGSIVPAIIKDAGDYDLYV